VVNVDALQSNSVIASEKWTMTTKGTINSSFFSVVFPVLWPFLSYCECAIQECGKAIK
jgi:hypothetical protein